MGRVYEVSFDTVVLKHRLSEFTDSTDSDGNFADLMNLVLYVPFSVFGVVRLRKPRRENVLCTCALHDKM